MSTKIIRIMDSFLASLFGLSVGGIICGMSINWKYVMAVLISSLWFSIVAFWFFPIKEKSSGKLIIDTSDPSKKTFTFQFNEEPENFIPKKSVIVDIQKKNLRDKN